MEHIMTPKEKAIKLFDNMVNSMSDGMTVSFNDTQKWKDTFKRCALIAVDEIIDFTTNKCCEFQNSKYWQEVKTEIELL
jgi:hypothetical protein